MRNSPKSYNKLAGGSEHKDFYCQFLPWKKLIYDYVCFKKESKWKKLQIDTAPFELVF